MRHGPFADGGRRGALLTGRACAGGLQVECPLRSARENRMVYDMLWSDPAIAEQVGRAPLRTDRRRSAQKQRRKPAARASLASREPGALSLALRHEPPPPRPPRRHP